MRLPSGLRLSKILAKDDLRPIAGAMVEEEEVEVRDMTPGRPNDAKKDEKHLVAYATNAYSFARVDLGAPESDKDVGGPIPDVALRHMEKGVNVELGAETIKAGITSYERVPGEQVDHRGKPRYKPGDEVSFPQFKNLYPEFGDNILSLGINPHLLADLADAMGSGRNNGVIIEIDLDKLKDIEGMGLELPPGTVGHKTVLTVMKVKTMGPLRDQAEGLIMPIRINA